jgi:hypothetical protein
LDGVSAGFMPGSGPFGQRRQEKGTRWIYGT